MIVLNVLGARLNCRQTSFFILPFCRRLRISIFFEMERWTRVDYGEFIVTSKMTWKDRGGEWWWNDAMTGMNLISWTMKAFQLSGTESIGQGQLKLVITCQISQSLSLSLWLTKMSIVVFMFSSSSSSSVFIFSLNFRSRDPEFSSLNAKFRYIDFVKSINFYTNY